MPKPRRLLKPKQPNVRLPYQRSEVESEDITFNVHSEKQFGPNIGVARGKRISIFLKSARHLKTVRLIERLIRAGVSVEEPFLVKVYGEKRSYCKPYLRKGRSLFVGKGEQLDIVLHRLGDESQRKHIFRNLAQQIGRMHRALVVHNDLSPVNITVNRELSRVSLIDFEYADTVKANFNDPNSIVRAFGDDLAYLFRELLLEQKNRVCFWNKEEVLSLLSNVVDEYKVPEKNWPQVFSLFYKKIFREPDVIKRFSDLPD